LRAEALVIGLGKGRQCGWSGLSGSLSEWGISLGSVTAVSLSEAEVEEVVKLALKRSSFLFITGDPGEVPSADAGEIAKKAVAKVLEKRLVFHPELLERLKSTYASRGADIPAGIEKMALLPSGARPLESKDGTPAGFYIEKSGRGFFFLPGLDGEHPLPDYAIKTVSAGRRQSLWRRTDRIRCYGIGEDAAKEALAGIDGGDVSLATSSSYEGVDVDVTVTGGSAGKTETLLKDIMASASGRLGEYIYTTGHKGMEDVVARLLTDKKMTLATAESCTGGLLAKRLTDVSGSSAYMDRGAVTYSNLAKEEMLGVHSRVLKDYGAVSKETAQEMAEGIRRSAKAKIGVSITGIAGPTGGTIAKPVGLVFIGLATSDGVSVKGFNFPGDRNAVRLATSQRALDLLRRYLTGDNE
jgi:nicotinamide-nucleotide amidase